MANPPRRPARREADEARTTMNVRGIKVSVVRTIRAAATVRGLTIGEYLEALMPEISRDLNKTSRVLSAALDADIARREKEEGKAR